MSTNPQSTMFEVTPIIDFVQLQYLQSRIETLESKLQKAMAHSAQKEAYANTLATDLEHIILQLKRLDVVK